MALLVDTQAELQHTSRCNEAIALFEALSSQVFSQELAGGAVRSLGDALLQLGLAEPGSTGLADTLLQSPALQTLLESPTLSIRSRFAASAVDALTLMSNHMGCLLATNRCVYVCVSLCVGWYGV